jgi:hypothetical protein
MAACKSIRSHRTFCMLCVRFYAWGAHLPKISRFCEHLNSFPASDWSLSCCLSLVMSVCALPQHVGSCVVCIKTNRRTRGCFSTHMHRLHACIHAPIHVLVYMYRMLRKRLDAMYMQVRLCFHEQDGIVLTRACT